MIASALDDVILLLVSFIELHRGLEVMYCGNNHKERLIWR